MKKQKSASKAKADLNITSTDDLNIPAKIVEQVIGQDEAVEVIKRASLQRRHVLLIGEPGTGKSMLGLALAEMLPKEKLVDVLSFPNPNDENQPIIKTSPAGKGRSMIASAKLQSNAMFKNQNIVFIIIAIIVSLLPYYLYSKKIFPFDAPVIYAASMITGIVFILGVILFINLGKRMGPRVSTPKIIVDNFGKKQAPFFDATGAHAGALLGDVLHDPFQCHNPDNCLHLSDNKKVAIATLIDNRMANKKVEKKEKRNYEAIFLNKNELSVLGETEGSVSPVDVLSSNRHDYDGQMIKLTTSENNEILVTPEHKIAIWKNGKIEYVEAQNIKKDYDVVAQAEDIIIDEQDIINTYDAPQQEQARLYYKYCRIKAENPAWGYKRISKAMGQKEAKTRWWHAGKHIPYPVQRINWLKQRGLLPLKIDNPKLPLIAKVLGATFGDGGIFENLNGIFLSSSEKPSVKEFGKDIEKIGDLDLNENSRIIKGGEYGHSWCYQNTNRNIIRFFLALKAPQGNKTKLELKVPAWIRLQEQLEDEFYASFFGGELGSPSLHKDKNRLTTLELGITGAPKLNDNRVAFLNTIADYLSKKRIKCNSIYRRKLDDKSVIYRLQIAKKMDNVLLFLMNTKLNYCKYKKDRLYLALGQWAHEKKKMYHSLLERGYGAEHAMKTLKLTPNSLYLLLNHFGPAEAST